MKNERFKQLKYSKARLAIMGQIAESGLKVGDRLPSVRSFAASLPYGAITISHALNDMKEEGMIKCRHGSGTYLARELKDNRFSNHILFLNVARRDQFIPEFGVDRIRHYLAERGIGLRTLPVYEFGLDIIEAARDALGILATGWLTEDFLKQVQGIRLPVLVVGNYRLNTKVPSVSLNIEGGAYRLAKTFIENGKKRPALFCTVSEEYYSSLCYYAGYKRALEEYGLSELILNMDSFLKNEPEFLAFMKAEKPDAILMEYPSYYNFGSWCLDNAYPYHPAVGFFVTPHVFRLYRQSRNFCWVCFEEAPKCAVKYLLNHIINGTELKSIVIEPHIPGVDDHESCFLY